jgi:hypothetical protein
MKVRISAKQAKEMLWLMGKVDWMSLYSSKEIGGNPEIDYELGLRKDSVLKVIAKFENAAGEK